MFFALYVTKSPLPFNKSHQPDYISIQTAYIHFLFPKVCIFS